MKISIVFGTRPELIKLARLIKLLENQKDVQLNVCFTGQHREMVLPLIKFFEVSVDSDFDIMKHNQSLSSLTSAITLSMESYLDKTKPDLLIVQGDTTTAMAAALVAFYKQVPVAHVEAGLRTHNMKSPFPEELNRRAISMMATYHYAPTVLSKSNLIEEGVDEKQIVVTGNTVIDALFFTLEKTSKSNDYATPPVPSESPFILITVHRRESYGLGFENICLAIKELAYRFPNYNFIYPVHLNPNVQEPVNRILKGSQNIQLLPPQDYVSFTQLMKGSHLILTDSGGIQEEGPALGKPVLVMRDLTERPEAVEAGTAKLIGTEVAEIVSQTTRLLTDTKEYQRMSTATNPFGDGNACSKIVSDIIGRFN